MMLLLHLLQLLPLLLLTTTDVDHRRPTADGPRVFSLHMGVV